MELTKEQQAILDGSRGDFLAKCMRWLVEWGKIMGARRLVKVDNGHGGMLAEYAYDPFGRRGCGICRAARARHSADLETRAVSRPEAEPRRCGCGCTKAGGRYCFRARASDGGTQG